MFGCSCYPNLTAYRNDKLGPKSSRCVFLGYSPLYRGYKCYDPITKKSFVSRHVIFDETTFPFAETTSLTSTKNDVDSDMVIIRMSVTFMPLYGSPSTISEPITSSPTTTSITQDQNPPAPSSISTTTLPTTIIITRSKSGVSKPKSLPYDFVAHHSSLYSLPSVFASILHSEIELKNYKAAAKDVEWVHSMTTENKALKGNNTWGLVPFEDGMNVLGSKWVYKIKYNSDGTIERYKSRLVAQGCTQQDGVDFFF